ncbi:hypothetical protein AAE478_003323 [Parahypoxylon ruwenzoriense]
MNERPTKRQRRNPLPNPLHPQEERWLESRQDDPRSRPQQQPSTSSNDQERFWRTQDSLVATLEERLSQTAAEEERLAENILGVEALIEHRVDVLRRQQGIVQALLWAHRGSIVRLRSEQEVPRDNAQDNAQDNTRDAFLKRELLEFLTDVVPWMIESLEWNSEAIRRTMERLKEFTRRLPIFIFILFVGILMYIYIQRVTEFFGWAK